ncbi:hypothetical protein CALVIDRAFT_541326 [Calocera viscosa TUFC12733]|uniref:Uncharacterized protein n=1 Tax=Calocera viscosa (strain TUFC12733) TaxID=1330018 RepID=A0A167HU27_CALVF|nr:hypothetical protein CALVIDRAFT_541326 [Calocera viscosa TUFC12733]
MSYGPRSRSADLNTSGCTFPPAAAHASLNEKETTAAKALVFMARFTGGSMSSVSSTAPGPVKQEVTAMTVRSNQSTGAHVSFTKSALKDEENTPDIEATFVTVEAESDTLSDAIEAPVLVTAAHDMDIDIMCPIDIQGTSNSVPSAISDMDKAKLGTGPSPAPETTRKRKKAILGAEEQATRQVEEDKGEEPARDKKRKYDLENSAISPPKEEEQMLRTLNEKNSIIRTLIAENSQLSSVNETLESQIQERNIRFQERAEQLQEREDEIRERQEQLVRREEYFRQRAFVVFITAERTRSFRVMFLRALLELNNQRDDEDSTVVDINDLAPLGFSAEEAERLDGYFRRLLDT